ncbi:MAG: hypothetical protein ACR2MN_14070 [Acidimicrobiales bacterium]
MADERARRAPRKATPAQGELGDRRRAREGEDTDPGQDMVRGVEQACRQLGAEGEEQTADRQEDMTPSAAGTKAGRTAGGTLGR